MFNNHRYYIKRGNKYFVNLCGFYSLTEDVNVASCWDDRNHKALWYYLHELNASTNQKWVVVDGGINVCDKIEESKDARTFNVVKANTFENVELTVIVEPKTFDEEFKNNKPIPQEVYYSELRINGVVKYMPIAKVNGKFYRYKHCLSDINTMTEKMWKW